MILSQRLSVSPRIIINNGKDSIMKQLLTPILLCIVLTACGGGGSSSASSDINGDVTSTLIGDVTIQEIEDVAVLEGVTAIEGSLRIQNISFEAFDFLTNITEIGGSLFIEANEDLRALSDLGLGSLQSVGGSIYVRDNINLASLSGLENLQTVGQDLRVLRNESLESLSGPERISSIAGTLSVVFNDNLKSLSGFEGIRIVSGMLQVVGNDNLVSLSGLENIQSIGDLDVSVNRALSSVKELSALSEIDGDFIVRFNDSICDYNVESLLDQVQSRGGVGGEIEFANRNCRFG